MKTRRFAKCALTIALSAALLLLPACSKASPSVGKVDNVEIKQSELVYYLSYYISNLENSLQASFEDFYAVSPESADAYLEQMRASATEQAVRHQLINRMFTDSGLTFDGELQEAYDSTIANYVAQFQGEKPFNDAVAAQGLSMQEFEELTRVSIKETALLDYFTGPGKPDEVTDETARGYFAENYTRVKHVLIKTVDDSNNPLPEDKIKEADARYEELMARAVSGEDFDALVAEYSEDPGSASQPDGYVFTMDESYMQEFKDEAFRLGVGEIGYCKTSYGHHIMKRYDLFEKPEIYDSLSGSITTALKGDVLDSKLEILRDSLNIEFYQDKLDALTLEEVRKLTP